MTLSEFEQKRIETIVREYVEKRRPPAHMRDKVDLSFRFKARSVEIFEIRPGWDDPSVKIAASVAKATYVKAKRNWKVFWKRADLKWHRYEPVPEVNAIEQFLDVVEKDHDGCFFG